MGFRPQALGLFFLSVLLLVGCRDDERVIADQVQFRISFSKKLVRTSFHLNEEHRIPTQTAIRFEELGQVAVYDDQFTQVGTTLNANPDVLNQDWPTENIRRLPGDHRIPKSVPYKDLQKWVSGDELVDVGLLYQADPQLVTGGAILSDVFNDLPKNFFATQHFENSAGAVTASISVAGPTDDLNGGLYFFGNFGVNPFDESYSDWNSNLLEDEVVWILKAKEPAKVQSWGHWWEGFFGLSSSWKSRLEILADDLGALR